MIRDDILGFAATVLSKPIPNAIPLTNYDPIYDEIFQEWIDMLKAYGWFISNTDQFVHVDPPRTEGTLTHVMILKHRRTPTEIHLIWSDGREIEAEHVRPGNEGTMYFTAKLSELRQHIKYTKKL